MRRRKTITFDKDVYLAIQKYRGEVMRKYPFENMTFTKAVNELLREGLKRS